MTSWPMPSLRNSALEGAVLQTRVSTRDSNRNRFSGHSSGLAKHVPSGTIPALVPLEVSSGTDSSPGQGVGILAGATPVILQLTRQNHLLVASGSKGRSRQNPIPDIGRSLL